MVLRMSAARYADRPVDQIIPMPFPAEGDGPTQYLKFKLGALGAGVPLTIVGLSQQIGAQNAAVGEDSDSAEIETTEERFASLLKNFGYQQSSIAFFGEVFVATYAKSPQ